MFGIIRNIINKLAKQYRAKNDSVIIYYREPERHNVLKLIRDIKNETEMLLYPNEAFQIYSAVKSSEKIVGDLAEVGVYKGGSAKIICEAKGKRMLHLFDTFTGLPGVQKIDSERLYKGRFSADLIEVKNFLNRYKNVKFYKGIFPETAAEITKTKFSFVNIDVDTFQSRKDCLTFFYKRINKGGILISHDYSNVSGVRKAFNEFFRDKPEPLIELTGTQVLFVKL